MAQAGQTSGRRTSEIAKQILLAKDKRFRDPSGDERKSLMVAFATKGKSIGKDAFDLVKCPPTLDLLEIGANYYKWLPRVRIYEVKGTREGKEGFRNHFFSMSTAELLAAQNLRSQYRFAFVNITTHEVKDWSLRQVLSRTKILYPEWAIRFYDGPKVNRGTNSKDGPST